MMTNGLQIMSSWSHGVRLLMEEDNPLTGDDPPNQQTQLFELPELECRECGHPLGEPWHNPRTKNCYFGEGSLWRRVAYFFHYYRERR